MIKLLLRPEWRGNGEEPNKANAVIIASALAAAYDAGPATLLYKCREIIYFFRTGQ